MQITSAESSRRLTLSEIRTLALASIGGALEFYDFVIFVFFTGVIGKLFFSADLPDWVRQFQTFGIFAAGYLARPLGGNRHGAFRRYPRPEAHVYTQRPPDGDPNTTDWVSAYLSVDWRRRPAAAAHDASNAGNRNR